MVCDNSIKLPDLDIAWVGPRGAQDSSSHQLLCV